MEKSYYQPLTVQIAEHIVREQNIHLVKDIESGISDLYYYDGARYVRDYAGEHVKGFVYTAIRDAFNTNPSGYIILEADEDKYVGSPSYINSLLENTVKIIKATEEIRRDDSDFDGDANIVNTKNGILDLRTQELMPHSPTWLLRNMVAAQYKNDEPQPARFLSFLKECLRDKDGQDNEETVYSLVEILASCLIGHNRDKLVYILVGKPNTGKSTLLNVLWRIFGDYAVAFNNSVLLASSRNSKTIRPEIIVLKGKRLMVGSESNKTEKFDTALVKKIAGNDTLSFRRPHKGTMIDFTVTGKLLLATNFCPTFSDLNDQAFLNRICIVDFNNIPEATDQHLEEKLLAERDAIFTLLADAAHHILKNEEIFIADRFKANKQRLIVNQGSSVARFSREHIRPFDAITLPAQWARQNPVSILYNVMYLPFCKRESIEPLKLEPFGKAFKEIMDEYPYVVFKRGHSNTYYAGLEVVGENAQEYNSMITNDMYIGSTCGNQYYYREEPLPIGNSSMLASADAEGE
jgi:P4 family phage/plasmid primase-like protien